MDVRIIFKELIIKNADSVDDACKRIEARNPDIIIDEAYEGDE